MTAMLKPTIVLLLVTTLAALALGAVYDVTKEPIARQKERTETETVARLVPGADSTEAVNIDGGLVNKVITCYSGEEKIGYAIMASPKGYGGAIDLIVGLNTDGVILGVEILSHSETPGLGANAASPGFTGRFRNKSGELRVVKAPRGAADEIQAVASATITSDAVVLGVNAATDYYNQNLR